VFSVIALLNLLPMKGDLFGLVSCHVLNTMSLFEYLYVETLYLLHLNHKISQSESFLYHCC
jgi:hypothetical protein